jgi:uncharacterized membrane protein YdbT with pleckstrin-like domain
MIPANQEQRLGHRSFMFLLYKRSSTAIGFFLVSGLVLFFRDFVATGLSGYFVSLVKTSMPIEKVLSISILYIAGVVFIVGVFVFLYSLLAAYMYYRNYTFTLEDYGIKMKKGIFYTKEISIPYRQIQNVNVNRSMIYQMFRISRLVIITAGEDDNKGAMGESTDSVFDPIDADIAEEIRSLLQKKIGVQIVEDTSHENIAKNSVQNQTQNNIQN